MADRHPQGAVGGAGALPQPLRTAGGTVAGGCRPDRDLVQLREGAKKTGGGEGWADVWKRHCFAWEYKGKHHDLNAALRQLQQYALALENPPLLIVSDLDTIVIHTNFTNTVHQVHTLPLESLADPAQLRLLKWAFSEPERLRPDRTTAAVTAEAAEAFASLAQRLRERGHEPQRVAHFITKLLFCMFAEDIGILPRDLFQRLLTAGLRNPAQFEAMAQGLFAAMMRGGFFGVESIPWFNGGLFNDDEVLPLDGGGPEDCPPGGAIGLERHRAGHLRHPVRAGAGPGQAQPIGRALHRQGFHPAADRPGDP